MAGSPKKRAKRLAAATTDPLDETRPVKRPDITPIPWNKKTLTDEGRARIAEALMEGQPRNRIAKALGTTVKTLKRLIDDDPLLLDAIDIRKDVEEAELRDILLAHARKGDTVAAIFLAKAQFGWRDRDEGRVKVEMPEATGVLFVPSPVPLDQWSVAAARQQAGHRQVDLEPIELPSKRIGTQVGEGMLMRKPDKRELSN